MAERDPIDLIKEQLHGIEKLTGLHADHEAFKQWHTETKTILEKAFSPRSIHCQNFLALRFREMSVKAFASPEIDKINAQRYKKRSGECEKYSSGSNQRIDVRPNSL